MRISKLIIFFVFLPPLFVIFQNLTINNIETDPETRKKVWFTSRSSVLFSVRFARGILNVYTPQVASEELQKYPSDYLVWHYLNSKTSSPVFAEIKKSPEFSDLKMNCALPFSTLNPLAAKKSSLGKPLPYSAQNPLRYIADLNSATFRNDVRNFLLGAKNAGCTSFQQDGPLWDKISSAYNQGHDIDDEYLDSYYTYLRRQIVFIFDKDLPITYNKSFHGQGNAADISYNRLAKHFDAAMAEVRPPFGPKQIYDLVSENQNLNLQSMTNLVSTMKYDNERHIASVYAFGEHPVVPWDIYLDNGSRYYGNSSDYVPLYHFVKTYSLFFDGFSTVYSSGRSATGSFSGGGVIDLGTNPSALVTLNKNSSQLRDVLHFVKWNGSLDLSQGTDWIRIKIDRQALYRIPQKITFYRPERPPILGRVTVTATDVLVDIPPTALWALGLFQ